MRSKWILGLMMTSSAWMFHNYPQTPPRRSAMAAEPPPDGLTPLDRERIEKARRKRERKAARKGKAI